MGTRPAFDFESEEQTKECASDTVPAAECTLSHEHEHEREHEQQNEEVVEERGEGKPAHTKLWDSKVLQTLKAKDLLIAELQTKLLETESNCSSVQEKLEQIATQNRVLKQESVAVHNKEQELLAALAERDETARLLRLQIVTLTQDMDKLRAADGLVSSLQTDKQTLEQVLHEKNNSLAMLQKQVAEQTVSLNALNNELATATARQQELQSKVRAQASIEASSAKLHDENKGLAKRIHALEQTCTATNQSLLEALNEIYGADSNTPMDATTELVSCCTLLQERFKKLQDGITQQLGTIATLRKEQQELTNKCRDADAALAITQEEGMRLAHNHVQEVQQLQHTITNMQAQLQKVSRSVETQTTLCSSHIDNCTTALEAHKQMLESAEAQSKKRDAELRELQTANKTLTLEVAHSNSLLDIKVQEHAKQLQTAQDSISKQEELIKKLSEDKNALQRQVSQLLQQVQEAAQTLERVSSQPKDIYGSKPSSQTETAIENAGTQKSKGGHVTTLELMIAQLREETIGLALDKRELEVARRRDLETRDATIRALESVCANLKQSTEESDPHESLRQLKIDLEIAKEERKMLVTAATKAEQDLAIAEREIARLRQFVRLSQVQISETEVTASLCGKLKARKAKIHNLRALLRCAKLRFDELSLMSPAQDRSKIQTADPIPAAGTPSALTTLELRRSNQRIQDLQEQCAECHTKLRDSLKVVLALKEEYGQKLLDAQAQQQEQQQQAAAASWQYLVQVEVCRAKETALTSNLLFVQAQADDDRETAKANEGNYIERIKQLHDDNTSLESTNAELKRTIKQQAKALEEVSARGASLSATVDALRKTDLDHITQQYVTAAMELSSARSHIAQLEKLQTEQATLHPDLRASDKTAETKTAATPEVCSLRAIIETQKTELEKLFESTEELRLNAVGHASQVRSLEQQLNIAHKRIELYRSQLSDTQRRYNDQLIHYKHAAESGVGAASGLALSVETHSQSRALELSLKKLLLLLETQDEEKLRDASKIWEWLCEMLLKSEQAMGRLERTQRETERRLTLFERDWQQRGAFDQLLIRCEQLCGDNATLQYKAESRAVSNEQLTIQEAIRREQHLGQAQRALHESNVKLLKLGELNHILKDDNGRLRTELETTRGEVRMLKVQFERDLIAANTKAEEAVCARLSLQNEELKLYFDTHIAKLVLGREDGPSMLALTREIGALKLLANSLREQLTHANKDKDSCLAQVQELESELVLSNKKLQSLCVPARSITLDHAPPLPENEKDLSLQRVPAVLRGPSFRLLSAFLSRCLWQYNII